MRQRDETKVNITQRSWSDLDGSVKVLITHAVFLSPQQVRCPRTATGGVLMINPDVPDAQKSL